MQKSRKTAGVFFALSLLLMIVANWAESPAVWISLGALCLIVAVLMIPKKEKS